VESLDLNKTFPAANQASCGMKKGWQFGEENERQNSLLVWDQSSRKRSKELADGAFERKGGKHCNTTILDSPWQRNGNCVTEREKIEGRTMVRKNPHNVGKKFAGGAYNRRGGAFTPVKKNAPTGVFDPAGTAKARKKGGKKKERKISISQGREKKRSISPSQKSGLKKERERTLESKAPAKKEKGELANLCELCENLNNGKSSKRKRIIG